MSKRISSPVFFLPSVCSLRGALGLLTQERPYFLQRGVGVLQLGGFFFVSISFAMLRLGLLPGGGHFERWVRQSSFAERCSRFRMSFRCGYLWWSFLQGSCVFFFLSVQMKSFSYLQMLRMFRILIFSQDHQGKIDGIWLSTKFCPNQGLEPHISPFMRTREW